jgi:L-lactate dehydrogenase complex protein LldF
VISPHYNGMAEHKHLSFASSLCGACTSVCPVKINLHNLLLLNRQQSVAEGLADKQERWAIKAWELAMTHKKLVNLVPGSFKSYGMRLILKDTWSKGREPLQAASKTFKDLWKAYQKKKQL